ncbi:MAG: hypothetical protein IPK94_07415 [Saprospiraceae bacterium]|nr:hypothetical protein [Saprospiraceae bacterium]
MMQNNTQTDKKTLKRREDLGWANLKNQLDIELPQKKKDKRVLWVVFLLGAGLFAGYAFFGPLIEMQPSIPEMSKQLPVSPSSVPDDKLMEVALQTNFNDAKEDAPLAKVDVSNTSQSPEESTPAVQKIFPKLIQILKKVYYPEKGQYLPPRRIMFLLPLRTSKQNQKLILHWKLAQVMRLLMLILRFLGIFQKGLRVLMPKTNQKPQFFPWLHPEVCCIMNYCLIEA